MRKTKLCRDKERIRILSLFPLENLSQAVRLSSQFSFLEKQDCQENTLQAATLFPEVISYLVLRNRGSQTSSPRVRLEFLLWWVCSLWEQRSAAGPLAGEPDPENLSGIWWVVQNTRFPCIESSCFPNICCDADI